MTDQEKIAELEATLVARNQQINQLDTHCRNLEERLKGISSPPTATVSQEADLKERNGVTRPKSGVTEQVWSLADTITYRKRAEGGFPATKAEVIAVAVLEGIKESTAGATHSAWCKFFEINPKDTSKPYVHKEVTPAATDGKQAQLAAELANEGQDTRLLYLMHPESSTAFCGYRKELAEGTLIEIGFVGAEGPSQSDYLEACTKVGITNPFSFDVPPPRSLPNQPAITFAPPFLSSAYLPPPPPPAYG